MKNPPRKIKILTYTYEIKDGGQTLKEESAFGMMRNMTQEILIDFDAMPEQKRYTTFHEVWHAIEDALIPRADTMTEAMLKVLSQGLFTVLCENPKLREYLFEVE